VTVSSKFLMVPPLGVTTTSMDALAPGATVLGTLANLSWSTASGGGAGVVGVVVGPVVCDFVGFAVGEEPGVVLGGVGDGAASASAADAVLLTRTTPVPTVMISGLRTDRARTAYNLLNDRFSY
jgi:hypothetical protein